MTARIRRITASAVALAAIAVILAACSGSSSSALTGKTWNLTSITEKQPAFQGVVPVDQQANYTILFKDGGNADIKADCNTVQATWKEGAGASLTITLGAATLMACPEGSMADQYLRSLGNTVSYGVNGTTLKLTQKDAGELQFTTK